MTPSDGETKYLSDRPRILNLFVSVLAISNVLGFNVPTFNVVCSCFVFLSMDVSFFYVLGGGSFLRCVCVVYTNTTSVCI